MKDFKCNNTKKIIPQGDILFKIIPQPNGQDMTPEQHQRYITASQALQELDFATVLDMADYIKKTPELQNL